MSLDAITLRIWIYDWILERGTLPTSNEIATALEVSAPDVKQVLGALKIGKTVLVNPKTGELWMAGPFSAVDTPYQVIGKRASWFANCAWDMLGIPILANEPVRIEARCTDCGSPMMLHVDASRPPSDAGVVHFLVPARRWYDDIGFT